MALIKIILVPIIIGLVLIGIGCTILLGITAVLRAFGNAIYPSWDQ